MNLEKRTNAGKALGISWLVVGLQAGFSLAASSDQEILEEFLITLVTVDNVTVNVDFV